MKLVVLAIIVSLSAFAGDSSHDSLASVERHRPNMANPGRIMPASDEQSQSGSVVGWGKASVVTQDDLENLLAIRAHAPECAVAGLNCDGVVDGQDLLIQLASWGQCADCDDCDADITGDCTVDGQDLLMLLANWD